MVRRLAAANALDVLDDLRDGGARLGEGGGVRGDAHAGMLPERIARRQRLRLEHVEVGMREMAGVERADEIRRHDVAAARQVDETAVLPDEAERARVQDAASLRRER